MPIIETLSVHDIVDVLLRKGHLDNRIFNQSSMQEGTRLHALYQREQEDGYFSEYPLHMTFRQEEYVYNVSGKADGVIFNEKGNTATVEEIKTTVAELDEFIHDHGQWHLGQAMFYAYMLAVEKNLPRVEVLMTYLKQQNYKISKQIRQSYSRKELETFVLDLILRYTRFEKKVQRFKKERNDSCKGLAFPFSDFRDGQKKMMDFVSKAAEEQKKVFIEAPTGIGKTISVLYPNLLLFGEGKLDRIFYLTSKNSIKTVAMNTMELFHQKEAKVKAIEFTSKEHICFNDKKGHCNPDECPFARHYYDKLFDSIFDALELYDTLSRKNIESICYQREMCPFQFQLDLSQFCDVLVMDCTYVYDYHDRLGLNEGALSKTRACLLVDECHNLPDRVRDMYSIEIPFSLFKDALSLVGYQELSVLNQDIRAMLKELEDLPTEMESDEEKKERIHILEKIPETFLDSLYDFSEDMKYILKKYPLLVSDDLLDFFYQVNSLYYLGNLINDEEHSASFLTYLHLDNEGNLYSIRIANLNSRGIIRQYSEFFTSVVYFSATLSPKDYYIDLLGGKKDEDDFLFLPSPFPKENRKVFVDYRLSLRYRDRDQTLFHVFSLCKAAIEGKKGNYFIFCPSFEYQERLNDFFLQDPIEDSDVILQGRSMSENKRDEFLSCFDGNNTKTTIGLLVLGGVFSEGIDLLGDRLIGAIVISVGIPQVSFERNHIKKYYDEENEGQKGFSYAYVYPGINRILQAAGRVIRSEHDKGFILFIDSRFCQSQYQQVFEELYPDRERVISSSQVRTQLKLFWRDKHEI